MCPVNNSKREQRQEEILDAALLLVQQEGIEALTMSRLSQLSGYSRPAIYQYFSSREEILGELLLNDMADLSNAIDNSLADIVEPEQQISAWVASTFAHLCEMQHQVLKDISVSSIPDKQRSVIRVMHTQFITTLIDPLSKLGVADVMSTAHLIFGAVSAASDRVAQGSERGSELTALQRFVTKGLPLSQS